MHRSPVMLALLGLACCAPLACASGPDTHTHAARETPREAPPASASATTETGAASRNSLSVELFGTRSDRLAAPVSVVASPVEAEPCEQMCGRVGDCLDERDPLEASALELSCLDLCVNVRDDAPVAPKFRGCEQRDSCDALLACAGQHWETARLARIEYDALVDASAVNPCEAYCTGVYGCMYFDKTIAQGLEFNDDTRREVDACIAVCDPQDPAMISAAPCTSAVTCPEYWECFESSSNSPW